ncbi:ROK family protein [Patescibacteria group bacterium]|nr:ROK family protein [Patescibacteria group bacterium]
MNNSTNCASIDWGGSGARGGIVEIKNGKPTFRKETYSSCSEEDAETIDEMLKNSVGEVLQKFDGTCDGIVFDVAGPIDEHRRVLSAANIPLLNVHPGYDLRKKIEELFKLPALVTNDLEAGLAGETLEGGALEGKKWGTLQNIGTGWGGSYLYNGVAVAAEPGHIWLPGNDDDEQCGCGRENCAEAQYSGIAIENKVIKICTAEGIEIPDGIEPCAFADQQAKAGEEWAVNLYTNTAKAIGNIWGSNLNNCPLITDIVIQGSFIEYSMQIEFFRQQVREAMIARSMNPQKHENVNI